MCGTSKPPYRRLACRYGADIAFTEMVKAHLLVAGCSRTWDLLAREDGERALGAQICGADEDVLARAAAALEASGFLLVDINMGCPVRKVVRSGAGAALLRDPRRVEAVVRACVRAVSVPVSVKLRSGWRHKGHAEADELARAAEQGGAALITIHGRPRDRRHAGAVDLDGIRRAKASVRVPVVGNGGIASPGDALRMLGATGCDAVMIGRGAHGRPWLFRDVARAIAGLPSLPPPGPAERAGVVAEHLEGLLEQLGPRGVLLFRKAAGWYFQGSAAADDFRARAHRIGSAAEMRGLVAEWRRHLLEEARLGV